MKPFKKVLVLVDFSAHSAEAVRYAADQSGALGSIAEYIVRVATCPVLTVRAPA